MARLIATRISDEAYSELLSRCSGLCCPPYEPTKVLLETELIVDKPENDPDSIEDE